MDERLKAALDFSNFRISFEIQLKTEKEKLDSKLTFGYQGGIFKINQTLICFLEFLNSKDRTTNVPVLDLNNNPILIPDTVDFQEKILDRYFSATTEYFNNVSELKKHRSVSGIVEYE
jgi:hypothetical protein